MTDCRCTEYQHHTLHGLCYNLHEDIIRYLTKSPENILQQQSRKHKISAFLRPELQCLFAYRLSHYLYCNKWFFLARVMSRLNQLVHKVNISPQSCIGPGCRLSHPPGVTFHGRAGTNLTLFSLAVCCGSEKYIDTTIEYAPVLGDSVQLGGHAVVIGPIRLGDRVKVQYMARVDCDIPDESLVVSKAMRVLYENPLQLGEKVSDDTR